MEVTRQAELSFLTWLREDWFLQQSENPTWKNRTSIALTSSGGAYSSQGYFNWVYYAATGVTYPPVISDDTGAISSSNYSINYIRGAVTFSGYTPTGTVRANFAQMCHTIRLSMEPMFELEEIRNPAVAVEEVVKVSDPLQLGGGTYEAFQFLVQVREYDATPYVAVVKAREIADIITRGLTDDEIPRIDFSSAFPLSRSGARNGSYDRTTQTDGYYDVDRRPGVIRNVPLPTANPRQARREITFTLRVAR